MTAIFFSLIVGIIGFPADVIHKSRTIVGLPNAGNGVIEGNPPADV